jgi:hypothetical protein
MTEQRRVDKGMVIFTPQPTAELHEILMSVVFADLPEAAAVAMGAPVPKVPLQLRPSNEAYTASDYAVDKWRRLRRWKF